MNSDTRKFLFRLGGFAIIAAVLALTGWAVYAVVAAFMVVVLEIP